MRTVPDGLWALYNRLTGMRGAFDVRRAFYDGDSRILLLGLRSRDTAGTDASLDIDGLPVGRSWTLHQDGVAVRTGTTDTEHDTLRLTLPVAGDTTLALRWR
ncbi:hypothetical protein ACGFZS_34210 [Streptomyces sp. NPDC048288]|uniref:hypothetical protein n=1 Tax=Streptomyces sp. NPDC048288 TaxID=3365529 RepID=UPI003717024B